jgi:hypothetical protein
MNIMPQIIIHIVICGINSVKRSAGKAGIPFIEFCSLAETFPDINRYDSERSAQFFYVIVESFIVNKFYSAF